MYRERPSVVLGAILWTRPAIGSAGPLGPAGHVGPADAESDEPVLPDGCLDLLWLDDDLVIAGPDTRPWRSTGRPQHVTGLRFGPGLGPSVLGVPADSVRNQRVPLAEFWSRSEVDRWRERVAERPGRLEELAQGRLRTNQPDPVPLSIARLCAAGLRTEQIADETGWSERTLHRRSLAAFGYGTKTLVRILRFQQALRLLRAGRAPAEVSGCCGYADQAHLTRECSELAGRTPAALRG